MIDVVITFLAILALVALTGAVTLAFTGARASVVSHVGPVAVTLAWLVATVATLGSLFLSEVAGFIPCTLCWVQRGFMYPLAVALAVPRVRRSPLRWATWWALSGSVVSTYHYLEQHLPVSSGFCDPAVPCSIIWVNEFGFVTIPFMALGGFLAVAALTRTHRRWLAASASQIGVPV